MTRPTRALALALLFQVRTATAQPAPVHAPRQRSVTVAGISAPVPEVRLALGVRTLVLFDAEIDRDSLVLDEARVRLVDAGARSLILQPVMELGVGERLGLRVRFRDGAEPQEAVLMLVSHPSEVDTQVDVVRRAQSTAACQAERAETQARCGAVSLAELVVSGVLDARGIVTDNLLLELLPGSERAATPTGGWIHVGPGWIVLALRLRHPPDERPWAFQEARLTRKDGLQLTVRAVRVKRTTPEGEELVVVEVASPEAPVQGRAYVLSLSEAPGAAPVALQVFISSWRTWICGGWARIWPRSRQTHWRPWTSSSRSWAFAREPRRARSWPS